MEKYAEGETLTRQETAYVKIFAGMTELDISWPKPRKISFARQKYI
ncbi:MAG: hypothetical protein NC307_00550 [Roseburia sp.]|nr:hypothetical protein [Roseburia sp.]